MADQIHVGTRKGLVSVRRGPDGWRVEHLRLENVAVTEVLDLGARGLLVGLDHGHFGPKIARSVDGGATFTDLATPAHPVADPDAPDLDPNRQEPLPDSTQLIWALSATTDGTLWCGTMPGALFRSTDDGASWTLDESLWNHPGRQS